MKYSVVMPVYLKLPEHKQVVVETIESIKGASEDYELIIVDDGSTESTGFLREAADVYVRQPNSGISRAWNVGMLLAKGDYVAIVNDDIKVPQGWLKVLEDAFSNQDCGVSGPRTGHFSVRPQIVQGENFINHKFYPGYCFMLKPDRFFEPFDVQFKSNCGDVDYWVRLEKAGFRCYKTPMQIFHKEGDVLKFIDDYAKLSETSIKLFETKHGFNPQREYYSWD